jgi:hypothetical protein
VSVSAQLPVIEDACSSEGFATDHCEAARIGTAVAITPLLRYPLRGGVYLVRRSGEPPAGPRRRAARPGRLRRDRQSHNTRRHALGRTLRHCARRPDQALRSVLLCGKAGSRGVGGRAVRGVDRSSLLPRRRSALFAEPRRPPPWHRTDPAGCR